MEIITHDDRTTIYLLEARKSIPIGTHMIGCTYIQYPLRIIWEENSRSSDWERISISLNLIYLTVKYHQPMYWLKSP